MFCLWFVYVGYVPTKESAFSENLVRVIYDTIF